MSVEYVSHFGLRETPFPRNQHPKWLYLSTQHKEAILKTRWTIEEHSGLSLLRGDVGYGKSSLIEYMMTAWSKHFGWKCAKLQNTGTISSPKTLVTEVMMAFGLPTSSTTREMVTNLETWLLNQNLEGNTAVLFIDEAQSISSRAFPVIRDLINLQTREQILMQIVLAGQLNLDKRLKNFPALRSRIASATTLEPLSFQEADAMLLHRFDVAGASDPFRICSPRAVKALYDCSAGIPRDFITLAEASMKEAFLRGASRIDGEHVIQAVKSLQGRQDYVPVFGPEEEIGAAPLAAINRAAAPTIQFMREYAKAA
jgi:general secretion pathway protein A